MAHKDCRRLDVFKKICPDERMHREEMEEAEINPVRRNFNRASGTPVTITDSLENCSLPNKAFASVPPPNCSLPNVEYEHMNGNIPFMSVPASKCFLPNVGIENMNGNIPVFFVPPPNCLLPNVGYMNVNVPLYFVPSPDINPASGPLNPRPNQAEQTANNNTRFIRPPPGIPIPLYKEPDTQGLPQEVIDNMRCAQNCNTRNVNGLLYPENLHGGVYDINSSRRYNSCHQPRTMPNYEPLPDKLYGGSVQSTPMPNAKNYEGLPIMDHMGAHSLNATSNATPDAMNSHVRNGYLPPGLNRNIFNGRFNPNAETVNSTANNGGHECNSYVTSKPIKDCIRESVNTSLCTNKPAVENNLRPPIFVPKHYADSLLLPPPHNVCHRCNSCIVTKQIPIVVYNEEINNYPNHIRQPSGPESAQNLPDNMYPMSSNQHPIPSNVNYPKQVPTGQENFAERKTTVGSNFFGNNDNIQNFEEPHIAAKITENTLKSENECSRNNISVGYSDGTLKKFTVSDNDDIDTTIVVTSATKIAEHILKSEDESSSPNNKLIGYDDETLKNSSSSDNSSTDTTIVVTSTSTQNASTYKLYDLWNNQLWDGHIATKVKNSNDNTSKANPIPGPTALQNMNTALNLNPVSTPYYPKTYSSVTAGPPKKNANTNKSEFKQPPEQIEKNSTVFKRSYWQPPNSENRFNGTRRTWIPRFNNAAATSNGPRHFSSSANTPNGKSNESQPKTSGIRYQVPPRMQWNNRFFHQQNNPRTNGLAEEPARTQRNPPVTRRPSNESPKENGSSSN